MQGLFVLKTPHLFRRLIPVLLIPLIGQSALNVQADLKSNTERLNRYLEHLQARQPEIQRLERLKKEHEERKEKERQARLERERKEKERQAQLERELEVKLESERLMRLRLERQEKERQAQVLKRLAIKMVGVPGGCFQTGGEPMESGKPIHIHDCLEGFQIGMYEVTQAQWRKVMKSNPSYFLSCGDDCPVERVSWNDIQEFLRKLNRMTGLNFRLPSEAEWEYACRGGAAHETYCGGDDIDRVGWFWGNSVIRSHAVGEKAPNGYGLYDMSGNVWEWTMDCWENSYRGGPQDRSARQIGDCQQRVARGGSWYNTKDRLSAANRDGYDVNERYNSGGLRLLLKDRP